ncbi:MAG: putative amidohydrolase YtcJ [Gammaproteobacteria bacterium]|jgi:predicted amidohydrolase YtcJ
MAFTKESKMNIALRLTFIVVIICMIYPGSVLSQQVDPRLLHYADSILINGKIVSMDDTDVNDNIGSSYEALAIRDKKIFSLGSNTDIRSLAGPSTTIFDLKGRTVIPGIVDTHAHIWDYAQGHWGPKLDDIEYSITAEDGDTWQDIVQKTLNLVAELKTKLNEDDWIIISWPRRVDRLQSDVAIRNHRILTRQMLDERNSEQKIVIQGNRGVMNTRAMEAYGVYFGGDYPEMDPETGIVVSATVDRLLFAEELYDMKTQIAMIGQEIKEWAAYGTTAWSSSVESYKQLAAVLALDAQKQLATRVAYGLGPSFYRTMPLHPYLLYDFRGYGTDMLWFNAWSTTSNDGAYPLLATSIEARPEIKEREMLRGRNEYTRDYAEAGLRFSNTHIAGDRTLDVTMDMIEQGSARAGLSIEQIKGKRHASDHCRLNPRPEQIPRLKKLGIIMSCAPKYIGGDGPAVAEDYGEEYLNWLVPIKSMIDGGVMVVYESDTHVVAGVGHFYYLGQMVTRETDDGVLGPDQRINRILALKTATSWAPYYMFKEDEFGSLEEGKFADLLILNKDYFDEDVVPDAMIKTIRPLMTMVGGSIQYMDPGLASEFGIQAEGIQPEQLIQQIHTWETGNVTRELDSTSNTDQ